MKDFALIFRSDRNPHANPSPGQLRERQAWIQEVIAQGRLSDKGARLSFYQSKLVTPDRAPALSANSYLPAPARHVEGAASEFVTGYIVIRAESIDEAASIAASNPILRIGGSIEIRAVLPAGEPGQGAV